MSPRPAEPPWLVSPGPGLEAWAIDPYFSGSHRAFLEGFCRNSSHRLTLFTLPGRHWKWRMHGGALTLAREARLAMQRGTPAPQVLFVSDMLDVPTFMALAPPELRKTPLILYFHENQLTYPLPDGVERDLGYAIKHVASALVADRVLFNSEFHRRDFFQAFEALLRRLPDEIPSWAPAEVREKSGVLPVGCELSRFDSFRPAVRGRPAEPRWGDPDRGPLIVWNQRWEYDKAPGDLFRALYVLQERGVPFRLAMAGPNQGEPTAELAEARRRLDAHLVQWGMVGSFADYASLLWAADVVVSTAIHEFFGVAVVEAIYCGCRPVLPRRLSYPELVPTEMHERVLYDDGQLISLLTRSLEEGISWSPEWQRTWVAKYDWGNMADHYDREVWLCWERKGGGRGADLA